MEWERRGRAGRGCGGWDGERDLGLEMRMGGRSRRSRARCDPEGGGAYSIKRYHSEKVMTEDSWRHERVVLEPLNPEFQGIEIAEEDAGEIRVVAEWLRVLE